MVKLDVRRSPKSRFKPLMHFDCIDEIEDHGMDEGCFFVHLKEGYNYAPNGHGYEYTMSFDNVVEAVKEVENVITL